MSRVKLKSVCLRRVFTGTCTCTILLCLAIFTYYKLGSYSNGDYKTEGWSFLFNIPTLQNKNLSRPQYVNTYKISSCDTIKYFEEVQAYEGVCHNVTVTDTECEWHQDHEKKESIMFPLHYVSGAPGSGNDWILWLASPSRYSWKLVERQRQCELYKRNLERGIPAPADGSDIDCLFLKSHEPWFHEKTPNFNADRAVLLLRHPYDAAFAEYKRYKAEINHVKGELKTTTMFVKTSDFFDIKTNKSMPGWLKYLHKHVKKFVAHSTFWLTEYKRPLHVMIYTDVKQNTEYEVEIMQKFLGYEFNSGNFRRHCCAIRQSSNSILKRKKSPVDLYRNLTLQTEADIVEEIEEALTQVYNMLDTRFPHQCYRIPRG